MEKLVTKMLSPKINLKNIKLEFVLEIVLLKFYKYIFNLKISTPSAMIYGEFGILPLRSDIQFRMISFRAKINEDVEEYERKLSPLIYKLVYILQNTNTFNSQQSYMLTWLWRYLVFTKFRK